MVTADLENEKNLINATAAEKLTVNGFRDFTIVTPITQTALCHCTLVTQHALPVQHSAQCVCIPNCYLQNG
eukprot:11845-Heterococcus_DN1.PRE.1